MDHANDASSKIQEVNDAARLRFENFRMSRDCSSSNLPNPPSRPSHGRSHSRNTSISSMSALSLSNTASSAPPQNDMSSNVANAPSGVSKRPNSHHRRRSSVHTRRESADMMGVSLPDLPVSKSDDTIDKDSIRRRALWALEGKSDLAFSKVEIPELDTPDLSKKMFDFPTKPSFPPGMGSGYSTSMSSLAGKRDSFGKFMIQSSSSKDPLHTLVEEEEEEEGESENKAKASLPSSSFGSRNTSSNIEPTVKSPMKPRPASLNLRPLSLVSGTMISSAYGNLPTPTLTPSPRPAGLRSLALMPSPGVASPATTPDVSTITTHRQPSISTSSTASTPLDYLARRPPLNIQCDSPSPNLQDALVKRRSSISYKRSSESPHGSASLPTPELTPTYERKTSELSSSSASIAAEDFADQPPLSAAEQHFLFKSHNALLSRITDLERVLSSRTRARARPLSVASDASTAASEPSDEMLQLISDLKAERDELKRDVDGWRTRVADLEKQIGIFARRVESERRDAWVARSRVGLLEVEKAALEKILSEKIAALEEAIDQHDTVCTERDSLKNELGTANARLLDAQAAQEECFQLRVALEEERKKRAELERTLEGVDLLATPTNSFSSDGQMMGPRFATVRPRGLGFQSVDSESSSTDVESVDDSFSKAEFTLNAVEEEDEDGICEVYDEDGLAGYEDEDDSDVSFHSPGGSSLGSGEELNIRASPGLTVTETLSRSTSPSPVSIPERPSHIPRASLSKTWTFPRGAQQLSFVEYERDEIDRFFGCLDDLDNSPPAGSFLDDDDISKEMFSSSFGSDMDDEDDLPPFVLPLDVGVVTDVPSTILMTVPEEEEEEEDMNDPSLDSEFHGEKVEGGIRFVFNPPAICITPPQCDDEPAPVRSSISRKPVPTFEFEDEEGEEEAQFTFPQQREQQGAGDATSTAVFPVKSSPELGETSKAASRIVNSPSSIPRSRALRSFMSTTSSATSTPPRTVSGRFVPPKGYTFITPPSKRGGTMPSFIPQPVSSPLRSVTPTKSQSSLSLSRQKQGEHKVAGANVNDPTIPSSHQEFLPESTSLVEDIHTCRAINSPSNQYPEHRISSLYSIMSSPLASRISLQTFTNFIPSWTPGAAAVASCIVPSNSSISSLSDVQRTARRQSDNSSRCSREKKYVSRETQLEKLRGRLGTDGRGCVVAVHACKACNGNDVHL